VNRPHERHLLVFAYYVPPLGMSGVQRVSKLLKYLPEFGWRCTLIAPKPGPYFAYDETLMADIERPGITTIRTASLDPTRLFGQGPRVARPTEGKRRLLSELSQLIFLPDNKIGWLPFALREAARVFREDPPDVVYASAPPYTGLLAGSIAARWSGRPFVADLRDDWLDNPRHVYPTPAHRTLQASLERWVLKSADRVLTINSVIAESIEMRLGRRVGVVNQGFDPEDFGQEGRPDPRYFTLAYTGVFYDAQRPDDFLQGVRFFLDRNPDAPLRLVFAGSWLHDTPDLVSRLGLEGVTEMRGYLPHDDVVRIQQTSDVLWMVIGRRSGADQISTGKLFEYVGARRPILALIPDGAAAEQLRGHGAATVCPPDDVQAIAESIGKLYDRWRSGTPEEVDESYVEKHDRRVIARDVASLLDDMHLDKTLSDETLSKDAPGSQHARRLND
jgi:glycosyltransferase involved in cell wall biosynthesis